MTSSEDIKGYKCVDCGGEATHFYHWGPICCECHAKFAEELLKMEQKKYVPSDNEPKLDDPPIFSTEGLSEDIIKEIAEYRESVKQEAEEYNDL